MAKRLSEASACRFEYLSTCPDYIETVAAWFYQAWSEHSFQGSADERTARLRQQAEDDDIPFTLLMFEGAQLVGAGSLIRYQSGNLGSTGAWLSNIYISPENRDKGHGNALVEALETIACQRGLPCLNLYTLDKRTFYARRGWSWQYQARISGREVDVMRLALPRVNSD